jgi:hypothetical protein
MAGLNISGVEPSGSATTALFIDAESIKNLFSVE